MTSSTLNYHDLFYQLARRNLGHMTNKVQEAPAMLSDTLRQKALHILGFGLELPATDWPLVRNLLLALAPKLERSSQLIEWVGFLKSGLEQSQAAQAVEDQGELTFYLGQAYVLLADYEQAKQYLALSQECFRNLTDSERCARALNRLAYVARLQRDFESAQHYLLQIAELQPKSYQERAFTLIVRGTIAYDHHLWNESAQHFEDSLKLRQQNNDAHMVALSYGNWGTALRRLARYEEAIACYQQAIGQLQILGDSLRLAIFQMNLGNVYLLLKQYQGALAMYTQAERMFLLLQDTRHLAMIHMNLALVYTDLEDWLHAESNFHASIGHYESLGNVSAAIDVICELGEMFRKQDKKVLALEKFRIAKKRLDCIKNDPEYEELKKKTEANLNELE